MRFVDSISRNLPTAAKLRIVLITALILTVPFFVYYLFYIKSQTDYFTNRNFRVLARVGNQITTKVESLSGVLKRVGNNFVQPDNSVADARRPGERKRASQFLPGVKNSKKNLEGLKDTLKGLKDYGGEIELVEVKSTTEAKIDSGQLLEQVAVEARAEDGAMQLYFDLQYAAADKSNVVTIRVRTDFDELIQPIVGEGPKGAGDEEGFADLLITEPGGDGRVLFQQNASELRLVSLGKLTTAGEEGKEIDLAALGRSSNVADVRMAGSEYKLFIHPLGLSIPQAGTDDGRGLQWVVCGLVPASRFRREVWAISYSLLIVLAFVTVLSILSWPFFKLVLIGPKDRLRTADIYFLFFSSVIGLALLTSLGLYGYSYTMLEDAMDNQLKELATQVKRNFTEEVRASLAQLDRLNADSALKKDVSNLEAPAAAATGRRARAASSQDKRLYRLKVLSAPDPAKVGRRGDGDVTQLKPLSMSPTCKEWPYPYFDTAVWIDEGGEQRLKWTVRDYPPQFINVSERPYFTALKEGRYRHLDDPSQSSSEAAKQDAAPSRQCSNPGDRKFWLEPIISKTTGRNEVEVSERMPDAPADAGQRRMRLIISAFDTRLISLVRPVLPAGFGFCVINDDGRVLFHSDEARHLGENFFEESDDNRSLRSAVIVRREDALDVSYLGRGHRVYTTPVDGFPDWTIVAFRDKQVLRTAFLELLTLSSLLFLVYCLVVLIFLSGFYLLNLNANERRAWLWPSSRRTLNYYVSVLVLLALSVTSVLVYSRSDIWSVVAVSLISFLGTCLFFLNLRFGSYGREWKGVKEAGLWGRIAGGRGSLRRHDHAYVLNIFFLFLLVAIIPAAAFFKFAYESEIRLFVKHGQITIAKGLAAREGRVLSQAADAFSGQDDATAAAFKSARLAETWDIYDGFFFKTTSKVGEAPRPAQPGRVKELVNGLISMISDLTPRYNQTSTERLGLGDGAFADRSYVSDDNGTSKARLFINPGGADKAKADWHYLETDILLLGWPSAPWLVAFFVLGVPFYLWVHFTVRKIFLLNLHGPTSYAFSDLASPDDGVGGNRFVVLEPPYTQRVRFNSDRYQRIDVAGLADAPEWVTVFEYETLGTPGKIIALDRFEHRASEPEANRQKMLFLEALLARGHRLTVVSTIEPARYCFGDEAEANGSKSSEDLDRWSWVVSNFFTVYMEDKGEPGWLAGELERYREKTFEEGARRGRTRAEVEELLRTLEEECNPKSPLQRLGLEIIQQPDFVTLTPEHLIGRVRVQAGTYYQDIWDSCSNDEKLTLYHLAQDRLLSPNDPEIARLLRKGLIVRDPDIHLMNESFRQFAKSERASQVVAEFEKEAAKGSLWQIIKAPLLVVLISVVLFLFITQRDLYTSSLAIMTAITTAIPAFFKVLSLFQKDSVNASSQQ